MNKFKYNKKKSALLLTNNYWRGKDKENKESKLVFIDGTNVKA